MENPLMIAAKEVFVIIVKDYLAKGNFEDKEEY